MVSNLSFSILGESMISSKKKLLLLCTQLISLAVIMSGLILPMKPFTGVQVLINLLISVKRSMIV